MRDGTDGFAPEIACPLAATDVIRCVEFFVERSGREKGRRRKKEKKARRGTLEVQRRGWGNKVTRWST
jgi:hypothetical protein